MMHILFIVDMKGMSLFNAGFPKVEGTDLSGQDPNGKLWFKEMMKTAQSKGWVDYVYSESRRSEPSQKWT